MYDKVFEIFPIKLDYYYWAKFHDFSSKKVENRKF